MVLILADNLPLIEPVPIDDELCSGLALIEDVSGIAARFVFYHTQTLYEVGATAFVVKKKLVLPCGLNCFDHLANADTLAALNHRSSSGYRAEIPNLVIMINGLCRSVKIGAVFV